MEKKNPLLEETLGISAGPPLKYKPEYVDQVYKFALLGLTDKEIAGLFEVHVDTIQAWKKTYPEFHEALIDGKTKADARVAHKLYDKAMGAEWYEEQAIKVKIGKDLEEIQIVQVKKTAPPDTQAINLWLTNRQKVLWRNRQNIGGDEENPLNPSVTLDTSKLSLEELLNIKKSIINETEPS